MNPDRFATLLYYLGLLVMPFVGSTIARRAGLGDESWLMSVFALSIVLMSQLPVIRLRRQVSDLQQKMGSSANDESARR